MIPFETWRAEIAADLESARADLASNLEALAEAEAAVQEAKRGRRELAAAIARIGQHPTLAGALQWRVHAHDAALVQVDAGVVRARGDVKSSHAKIRDLEDALLQLHAMAPPVPAADTEAWLDANILNTETMPVAGTPRGVVSRPLGHSSPAAGAPSGEN